VDFRARRGTLLPPRGKARAPTCFHVGDGAPHVQTAGYSTAHGKNPRVPWCPRGEVKPREPCTMAQRLNIAPHMVELLAANRVIGRGALRRTNAAVSRQRVVTAMSYSRTVLLTFLATLLPAGLVSASATSSLQPAGWDAGLKLAEAADTNPDPHIVEIVLEARLARVEIAPGEFVEAWTYNGTLPGPLIRVRVGQRLIVHFTNTLPGATTVHWHGIRVPFGMDGVPGHSQAPVNPGESFTYDFVARDAGLYWYHPHVRSAAQVGFGLYGALLVDDPGDAVGVADELVLVLSDLALQGDGTLQPPDGGGAIGTVFGREGEQLLVNGHKQPTLRVRAGAPQRWRIVNTAKSRYFDLDLGGASFTQIGGDGGLQEYAVTRESIVLAPGERVDVIVTPPVAPGETMPLRSVIVNRGFGSFEGRIPYDELMTITAVDLPAHSAAPRPPVRRSIEPLSASGATAVKLEMTLTPTADEAALYGLRGPFSSSGHGVVRARVGETQIWTVTNATAWSHPLHLHGFFFQVLDEKGVPLRPLAWKDTVDIPFEKTVRLLVRFDDRDGVAGRWMIHCHILDHAEAGLMSTVDVGPGQPPAAGAHGPSHRLLRDETRTRNAADDRR
jgi:FtsP/CotA-like multicopper oxidase with cupredoxin domain